MLPVDSGPPPRADVERALAANGHVQKRAARALGVSHTTLDRWLKALGIARPADLSREEIDRARAETNGDVRAMARLLNVSVRGLKLRLIDLGSAP